MKKENIIIPFALLALTCLSSCSKSDPLASFSKKINSSSENVTEVKQTIVATDNDVKVYEKQVVITIVKNEDKYDETVNTKTYSLKSDFKESDEETTTSSKFESMKDFIKFDLKKEYFETYKLESNKLTAKVNSTDVNKVFDIDSYNCGSAADLSISLEKGKISNFVCSYTTTAGLNIDINVIYNY